MLNWEFLLQKKGDDSWLPLEATSSEVSVEILEGFYRLAARSTLREAPVTIQLQYFPFDSSNAPIKSSLVKNVNRDGLLIVLTYTHLTPGIWQIGCALGDSSLAKLQFDVLPLSFESENFEPDPELIELENTNDPELSQYQSDYESDRSPTELIKNDYLETELGSIPATSELLEVVETAIPSLEEVLAVSDQTTNQLFEPVSRLLTAPAETQVLLQLDNFQFVVGEDQLLQISGIAQLAGELEVILNDPQEMRMVVKQKFSLKPDLSNDRRPYPFKLEIDLPPQNGVLIGTVQLLTNDLEPDSNNQISYQAISVTFLPAQADLVSDPLNHQFAERSNQIRPVNLPSFNSSSFNQPSEISKPFNSVLKPNSTNFNQPENLLHSLLLPNLPSDRFLDKLQQLSKTSSPENKRANESQLESIYQDLDQLLETPIASQQSSPQLQLPANTVLAIAQPEISQTPSQPESVEQPQIIPAPVQIISPLPRHQSLPQPKLQTESTELTSGYPISMIVELPVIASNLAVRLWAKDCQTRQIIDGPRWLMDFKMLSDRLQCVTQITIPLGTVEILFEAVTVEIQSQRESYKTKLILSVVPPNLNSDSDLSWLAE